MKIRWSKARLGERLADLRAAGDDRDLLCVEGLGEHLRHQLGGRRRELRRLDHRPVAGRQHAGQRREGQVHREVPGADDPDHALGLEADLGLGAEQPQDSAAWSCASPASSSAPGVAGVLERPDGAGDVGEGRGLAGARAEIGVQRLFDLVAVVDQEADATVEAIDPQGGRGAPSRRWAAFCLVSRSCRAGRTAASAAVKGLVMGNLPGSTTRRRLRAHRRPDPIIPAKLATNGKGRPGGGLFAYFLRSAAKNFVASAFAS